jgi:hypothetical protein
VPTATHKTGHDLACTTVLLGRAIRSAQRVELTIVSMIICMRLVVCMLTCTVWVTVKECHAKSSLLDNTLERNRSKMAGPRRKSFV